MSFEAHAKELLSSLAEAGIKPGSEKVIPHDFKPSVQVDLAFDDKPVSFGNLLRVSDVKKAPGICLKSEEGQSDISYTLMLIDPDAPTPDDPKFAYWRHWVLPGLRPLKPGAVNQTKPALTEYLGPGPKDDSRPHRYLFLLYREPANFNLEKSDVGGEEFIDRRSFNAADWTKQHGLELVGINWMRGAGDGWKE